MSHEGKGRSQLPPQAASKEGVLHLALDTNAASTKVAQIGAIMGMCGELGNAALNIVPN